MNPIKLTRPKRQGNNDPFYQSKAWKRFRDGDPSDRLCVDCKAEGKSEPGLVYDHIKQRSLGGADFPPREEMRWLCRTHDQARRGQQSKNARAK